MEKLKYHPTFVKPPYFCYNDTVKRLGVLGKMTVALWILIIILAAIAGVFGGIFIARKQIEKEIGQYPRLTPDAIREMMSQMGQKPNEAKVQQTYRNIVRQSKAAAAKKKK